MEEKILIAYFTHRGVNWREGKTIILEKGNTEIVAEKLQAMTDGTLFEIRKDGEYPKEDYKALVAEAMKEFKAQERPKLEKDIDTSPYGTVIICYPNWCGTAPMPVFSFIEQHDLKGKKIFLLCTNEGSGMGRSVEDAKKSLKDVPVASSLSVKGADAEKSDGILRSWAEENGILE